MGMRRVVTGHDEHGKADFASDEVVEADTMALVPGSEFYQLWGSDERSTFPDDGRRPDAPTYFPGPNGFGFGVSVVEPNSAVLGPGDTVVQDGARHAWRNPFDEPATLVVLVAADHHNL